MVSTKALITENFMHKNIFLFMTTFNLNILGNHLNYMPCVDVIFINILYNSKKKRRLLKYTRLCVVNFNIRKSFKVKPQF